MEDSDLTDHSRPPGHGSALDLAYLREISDGDAEFEQEIVSIYLKSTPPLLARLREGVEGGRTIQVLHAAHTLKGSSRSVGARVVADVSAQIEADALVDRLDLVQESLPALESAFTAVLAEASRFFRENAA